MRIPLLLLTLALLAACSGSAPAGIEATRLKARGGEWQQIDAERQGFPVRWQMRAGVTAAQITARPQLLVVSAHYTAEKPGAAPTSAQALALDGYEDRLIAALRAKAILVATLNWNQQRDWYFYTESPEDVLLAHQIEPPSAEADLNIGVEPDTKGDFYTKLREKFAPR